MENVSRESINLIIDRILKDRIISATEKELILEKSNIRADQARCLFDTVKNKGTKARTLFVSHMKHLDPRLHQALWPSSSQPAAAAGELTRPNIAKVFLCFFFFLRNKSMLTTSVLLF